MCGCTSEHSLAGIIQPRYVRYMWSCYSRKTQSSPVATGTDRERWLGPIFSTYCVNDAVANDHVHQWTAWNAVSPAHLTYILCRAIFGIIVFWCWSLRGLHTFEIFDNFELGLLIYLNLSLWLAMPSSSTVSYPLSQWGLCMQIM